MLRKSTFCLECGRVLKAPQAVRDERGKVCKRKWEARQLLGQMSLTTTAAPAPGAEGSYPARSGNRN